MRGGNLVSDGTTLYWVSGGWVLKCGVDGCGGKPTRIDTPYWDSDHYPNRVAVDDKSVYWTTGRPVMGTINGVWLRSGGTVMKLAK